MMSYDEACRAAATAQGLDPVLAAFEGVTDLDAQLYQSGGFTMLVEVIKAGIDVVDRYVWISDCTDDETQPCYLLGLYTPESLDESTEGLAYVYGIVAADLVDTARKLLTDGVNADIPNLEVQ